MSELKKRRSPWAPLYLTLVLILMYLPIAVVVLFVVGFIKKHRMKLAAQAEQAK